MNNTDVYTELETENVAWSDIPNVAGLDGCYDRPNAPAFDVLEESFLHSWAMMQLYGTALIQISDGKHQPVQTKTLPERLAALLVDLGNQHGGLLRNLSQQSLANQLGTQRETINALLRSFHRQGLIRIGDRQIGVVNAEGLAELAW